MSKDVKTIPGRFYTISFSQSGTAQAKIASGTLQFLASSDAGGQVLVQAISDLIVVSDDKATVSSAKYALSHGAETSIEDLLFNDYTDVPTPQGTDNCSYVYADIPAKYIPSGSLRSISLQCAENIGDGYSGEAYLVVWQEQAPGTDNFQPVAVSKNAVVQQANTMCEWLFDAPLLLNERIRFYLSSSPVLDSSFAWSSDKKLRSRVMLTPRWQDGHVFTPDTLNCLPELIIRMNEPSDKYAPMSHTADSGMHLSSSEREALAALLARKDDLLALLPATQELLDDEPVAVGGEAEGAVVTDGAAEREAITDMNEAILTGGVGTVSDVPLPSDGIPTPAEA